MRCEMISDKILTKEKFCVLVEQYVHEKNHSYMDAVLEVCKSNSIEPDETNSLLNMSIKDKIEYEARELNYLEKVNKLPL
tara:strand:+ start:348 stop:587 length:240 start_codon:yes stop_codon:yes gene_type:complete